MSYQYPSGLQAPPAIGSGFVDAAGYAVNTQSMAGMTSYPAPGLAAGGPAGYPPMPAGVGAGYPTDPYSASAGAYPPQAGGSLPMGGASTMSGAPMMGGINTNDLYAHAQQYGLSRGEVDAAVQTYQEMSNMDRSMLTSLGSGTLQNFLRRIFGGSSSGQSSMMGTGTGAGMVNDQFMSNVSRILTTTLSTGRLPNIKEFLTLLGTNKMQYGAGGKFNSGMGTMGAMGQQQQQYMQGAMGQQQQQYPGMGGGMGMGMGMQQSPQAGMGQQYPGMGGGMPPY